MYTFGPKTGYEAWKEDEKKKSEVKKARKKAGLPETDFTEYRPVQYTNTGYQAKSDNPKKSSFEWEKALLPDLSIKKYGRSNNDKFSNAVKEIAGKRADIDGFRKWLDAKEEGVQTKNSLTNDIVQSSIRKQNTNFDRLKKVSNQKEEKPKESGFHKFLDMFNPTKKESASENGIKLLGNILQTLSDSDKPLNKKAVEKAGLGALVQHGVNSAAKQVTHSNNKEVNRDITRLSPLGFAANELNKGLTNKPLSQYDQTNRSGLGKASDLGVDALSYLLPGAGALKAVKGAGLGVKEGAQGLTKLRQLAQEGALTGAGLTGAEIGIREGLNGQDYSAKDNLKYLALGTGLGAVGDPLVHGAGQLLKGASNQVVKRALPSNEELAKRLSNALMTGAKSDLQTKKPSFDDFAEGLQSMKKVEPRSLADSPLMRFNESAATVERPREFEAITSAKEVPMKRIKEDAHVIDQSIGNADTFHSKIDRNKVKKENGLLGNLRTQFIDDVAPLENLEKKITGEIASAENSLYKQARLFRGSPEKAHQIVREQMYPVIKSAQDNKISMQDLGDYALAIHAKNVNFKGINSGFTNAEINDVINKLGSPQMEKLRKEMLGVNNHVLDMLSSGEKPILDPEHVKAMREKWPNYVSLFRSFDDDKVDFANGLGRSLVNASNPIKKLEGSSRNVIDPMESMIKNIFKATNAVERNKVASQVGKLAEKDAEGAFIRRVPDDEDTKRLNVISVMNKGKKEKYEVPPDVYKTLNNLDKESTNTLVKILQKPASTLRAGATLTPEFSLRNPMRDVPQAFIVSKSGFNPVTDFTYGLVQSIGKGRTIKIGNKVYKTPGELYKQFLKENGGYGNIVSGDRELHQKTLKKAITEADEHYIDVLSPKTLKTVLKKLANPFNTLRTIADVSESATKVGEFRAALRKGTTPQEAAYRARDIMDFARAGVSVREANKVVAFLNANIQGKSKLYRAFKENPTKVTGKAVASVTIPTIAAIVAQNTMANNKQKEILDDAPQWLKDTFYLFPIPGTDQIARIPKPFDLAQIFSNPVERAFDFMAKHDKEAFKGFIKQGFSSASVPVMLTGIAPIIEGMANYSFFTQGNIIPQREQNLEFPDQFDVNTTETAKFAGKQIDKLTGGQGAFRNFGSPRVIDNTIQGFTGGVGTYATSAVDWLLNKTNAVDNPDRPAKNIDQKPLAKAFLFNQSSSGDSLDKFYNFKEKLTKMRGSAKQNDKPFAKEELYDQVNDMNKELSDLNKEIRTVQNSRDYNAEQKRKMLDALIRERNEFARKAVDEIKRSD